MGRQSILLLGFLWLAMASMAVAAVWLVEPAKADSPAATGHEAANDLGNLTVRVENVSAQGGVLRLGLYDAVHYPDDKADPIAYADVPANGSEVDVTLKNVPAGRYAIEIYQDVNSNKKMDMSWLGLPLEPYGFSHDARPFLSKPDFGAAAFALLSGENSQILHLQNSHGSASAGL